MLKIIYSTSCRATHWLAILAGTLVMAVVVTTLLEVVLRYVFNRPTYWSIEVSSYLLLYSIFLASPYAMAQGTHVSLDLVRTGRVQTLVANLLGMLFVAVFTYESWIVALEALEGKSISSTTLALPLFPLYVVIPIGLALTLLVYVLQTALILQGTAEQRILTPQERVL